VGKRKAKKVKNRPSSDTYLTPEDHERITMAFRFTLGEIRKLRKSQITLYGHCKNLKRRIRELEKQVTSFIKPS
jgi:hypothetical protein